MIFKPSRSFKTTGVKSPVLSCAHVKNCAVFGKIKGQIGMAFNYTTVLPISLSSHVSFNVLLADNGKLFAHESRGQAELSRAVGQGGGLYE